MQDLQILAVVVGFGVDCQLEYELWIVSETLLSSALESWTFLWTESTESVCANNS